MIAWLWFWTGFWIGAALGSGRREVEPEEAASVELDPVAIAEATDRDFRRWSR